MATGSKATSNRIEWKIVDLFNKSLPEDVNKEEVILTTGTIKIEVLYVYFDKGFIVCDLFIELIIIFLNY
jgi:hypothetical protein